MKKRGRVDSNQKEIVAYLRKLGFTVHITSQLGSGFPDAVAGLYGINFLVEIKDSKKFPSQRKLTKDEEFFHSWWRGRVHVLMSFDDCLNLFNEARVKAKER